MPETPTPSAGMQAYPYSRYRLTVNYLWDAGVEASPVAYTQGGVGGGQTARAVVISKPQGRKVIDFEMIRQGVRPEVPNPLSVSANEVLLKAELVLDDPHVDAGGDTYLYSASGRYEYMIYAPIFTDQSQYPQGATEVGGRQFVGDLRTGGIDS